MSELERITGVASELFFQYGIRSVSMDDIARQLGISKKTLYQHVENKADLVEKTMMVHNQHMINQFTEIINDDHNNAIDELVEIAKINNAMLKKTNPSTIYDLKKYHKKCWDVIEKVHDEIIFNIISKNIEQGIEQGLYREDINIQIITKFYAAQIDLIIDTQVFSPTEFQMADVYIEFLKYHIFGIATTKGAKYLNEKIHPKSTNNAQ